MRKAPQLSAFLYLYFWGFFGSVFALFLMAPAEARANPTVALEFNVGVPRLPREEVSTGVGFDARIGDEVFLDPVYLTPEVAGGYMALGVAVARFGAGLRFGVRSTVAPALFIHAGYGVISYSIPDEPVAASGAVEGVAFDTGFALDFRPEKSFSAGIHVAYNGILGITDSPAERGAFGQVHWLSLGAHAAAYF
jgi:hypothetical protein